jgi:putative transposase
MLSVKAYKYRIYPNKKTKKEIDKTIWLCRTLYNAALNERIDEFKLNGKNINYQAQSAGLPFLKEHNDFMANVYSQVLQNVLKRVDTAYQNFFRRVKQGIEKPGFPRFQGVSRYNSFTYPQGGFSMTNNWLSLSKIGKTRVFAHRPLEGKVKTCTIIRKNGKYYVCFSCEVESQELPLTGQAVGIDMGIKVFCATSDGELIESPKTYRKAEKSLKRSQRSVSRKKKGSKRRRKAVLVLAKKHEHVANQRKDIAYKTAHSIFQQYDLIAHEDLNIKGMVKNHRLAKSISDAGWGIFFNILKSKAKQTLGKQVIAVDPRYTSQTCSHCGHVSAENRKDQAHFKCVSCGFDLNADVNAALNIKRLGLSLQGLELAAV